MGKKTPRNDEWYEPPYMIGVGQYHSNREPATGKSKHKHPIGFIRPKVKTPRKNAK